MISRSNFAAYKEDDVMSVLSKILLILFFVVISLMTIPILLRLFITRVEDVDQIKIDSIVVATNSITISGQLYEDNTSMWSYKNFNYSIEDQNLCITIKTYPEIGKRVFSNLGFSIIIEGDFSIVERISLKDAEKNLVIWGR